METNKTKEQFGDINLNRGSVHKVLAHSYLFFFVSFLVGLILDFIFQIKIFENIAMASVGVIFLVFGTALIYWAQKSSHDLKIDTLTKETFYNGPYRYTRSPTHYGLFFLMFGFGITSNALFVIIFSAISLLVTKFVFLKKEEKILAEKYGAPYLEYKKTVKL